DLRLPQLPEESLPAEHIALVWDAEPRIENQRGRLHAASWSFLARIQRCDPTLGRWCAFAVQPACRAGEFEHRRALLRSFGLFENARCLGEAAQLEEGEPAPQRMLVVGQLFEPACLQKVVRVAHIAKMCSSRVSGTRCAAQCRAADVVQGAVRLAAPSVTSRLEAVPWGALEGLADTVVPAIARVLRGAAAEREIDALLRANRALGSEQRAAVVESVFGVGLWRRRLAVHAGSNDARALLVALLRDLGGVDHVRAAKLAGFAAPLPARVSPPVRLADRWSYPDWIEAVLLRESDDEAEALAAAMCAPGPICLRVNTLRATPEQVARALESEGVFTRPARFVREALIVSSARPNLLALAPYR